MRTKQEGSNIAFLKHAGSAYELGSIKAILDENQIPYILKEKGHAELTRLYTGAAFATDIYVPEQALDKAKELLETIGFAENNH